VALVADRSNGTAFKAKIDVLESMGSEYYAYFVVASKQVSSTELEELAEDIGSADLPRAQGGVQVTARLSAESRVKQGQEAELWFDSKHLQLFDAESGQSLLAGNGGAPAGGGARSAGEAAASAGTDGPGTTTADASSGEAPASAGGTGASSTPEAPPDSPPQPSA
jgi:hypothetical protein